LEVVHLEAEVVELDPGAVALPHAGDLAVAEVGEQVRAREPGNPLPAIDVAARHRAPVARSVLVDGADRSRRSAPLNGWLPSRRAHPRFAPRPDPAARKSTSSHALWPTSPIQRSPVLRSNE